MYRDGLFTPMAILSMVSSAVDRLKEKAHSSVSTEWSIVEIGSTHRSGSPSYSLLSLSLPLSLSLSLSLPPSLSLSISLPLSFHCTRLRSLFPTASR